jgi:hypothetical protein
MTSLNKISWGREKFSFSPNVRQAMTLANTI